MPDIRNVLYITVDDLRPDLGCYGHPLVESPHIDRLANGGRRFEQAYCQGPHCAPSRQSFLSGLYPQQIPERWASVRESYSDLTTLPGWFRAEHGTAARVGKLYHQRVPTEIGENSYDDPESWDIRVNPKGIDVTGLSEGEIVSDNIYRPDDTGMGYATEGLEDQHTDSRVASETIDLLDEFESADDQFFLAAGFYRPHVPLIAPKRYFDLYDIDDINTPEDKIPERYAESLVEPTWNLVFDRDHAVIDDYTGREQRAFLRAYYACISYLDAQVGRVLDALDRFGLRDSTLVILHADHGIHRGENCKYEKTTLFERSLHVPLIFAHPSFSTGSTDAVAELLDMYPTVVDLLEGERPAYLAGTSQRPVLEDPETQVRDAAYSYQGWPERGITIRTDRYRYTEWWPDRRETAECYDHRTDPGEYHNLASDPAYDDLCDALHDQLEHHLRKAETDPPGLSDGAS